MALLRATKAAKAAGGPAEPALSRNVLELEDPGSVFDKEVLISVLPSGFGVCSVQGMATGNQAVLGLESGCGWEILG
jgi:hypothetical protein